MTVGEHIREALLLIGAIDPQENDDASFFATALSSLNSMLGSWSAQTQALFVPTEVSHTLADGTASYTIGSGATIDTARPQKVLHAFLRDGDTDYDVTVKALENYQDLSNKSLTGRPSWLYYRPGYPTGTLYLHPVPDAAYTLVMQTLVPLSTYAAQGTSVSLPPEYDEAITYNLAVRLGPKFRLPVPPEVAVIARESLGVLKRKNAQPVPVVRSDPFSRNYSYDIYGDR